MTDLVGTDLRVRGVPDMNTHVQHDGSSADALKGSAEQCMIV